MNGSHITVGGIRRHHPIQNCPLRYLFPFSTSLATLVKGGLHNNTPIRFKMVIVNRFLFARGRPIGSHKLQTSQFNLGGLQATGTRQSRIPKASLGYE